MKISTQTMLLREYNSIKTKYSIPLALSTEKSKISEQSKRKSAHIDRGKKDRDDGDESTIISPFAECT